MGRGNRFARATRVRNGRGLGVVVNRAKACSSTDQSNAPSYERDGVSSFPPSRLIKGIEGTSVEATIGIRSRKKGKERKRSLGQTRRV